MKLFKGEKVDLTKQSPALTSIRLGLGWNISGESLARFDLDAVALLVDEAGLVLSHEHIVFYNQLTAANGAVVLSNDNQTGAGTGDDEEIFIQLSHMPPAVDKVVVAIFVHEGEERGHSFGQVNEPFVRVVNDATKKEMYRYKLGLDFSDEKALIVGEVCRKGSGWTFEVSGKGVGGGLASLCQKFGMNELPASFFKKKKTMTKLSPLHSKKPLF
ncbi:TerD family protein [Domibacillus epiphyticus]|uniref:TerD domain-containing protein n=1 Tax=Domibacillus epiphyticus TaxID=1714355 RepID=A0A1V2A7L6_9BACI|nr:TerD family protein [Domibacillus epiphyticus]OMP67001.1 hypothetical protein BTO28_08380 [Domibacillus epiphyticus]